MPRFSRFVGMDVLVAGGHGQIARRLLRLLARDGHTGRGLIRNPDHVADLEADGALPVLCDLEHDDVRPHVGGADAFVFAAGAGPGSGDERKRTVDLGGAVKCIEACRELGVARFVIVSSMGTDDIQDGPMRPYFEAKAQAGCRRRGERPGLDDRAPGLADERPGDRARRPRAQARPVGRDPARRRGARAPARAARPTTRSTAGSSS